MGTERIAPAMPHMEPQNVSATTIVSEWRSSPDDMSLGSMTLPRELWTRNGTRATMATSTKVLSSWSQTKGTGAKIAMKDPMFGMKLSVNVMIPKMKTKSTFMSHKLIEQATAMMKLAMVFISRYRCIKPLIWERGIRSWMPGSIATNAKKKSNSVSTTDLRTPTAARATVTTSPWYRLKIDPSKTSWKWIPILPNNSLNSSIFGEF
mmetsp:Transcript_57522/g.145856  ORF Transcript_57522/g.145856 Transcript_57522/m.145856 type:complete len:207 (-) Transcript_57522:183-803(-)